jgi:hypothetical protein
MDIVCRCLRSPASGIPPPAPAPAGDMKKRLPSSAFLRTSSHLLNSLVFLNRWKLSRAHSWKISFCALSNMKRLKSLQRATSNISRWQGKSKRSHYPALTCWSSAFFVTPLMFTWLADSSPMNWLQYCVFFATGSIGTMIRTMKNFLTS